MQRAAFPELQGRPRPSRHRRQDKPDRVLIGLKIATFLAACGVIGVIVLLAVGGPGRPTPAAAPPKIVTGQLGDDAPQTIPTPTTPKVAIAPPALRTETTEFTQAPTTSRSPRPAPPASPVTPPAQGLPVVGEPCPAPGMWSMTANYEPVYCYGGTPPRWRRVF
jgi:hypothetical protein